MSNLIGRFYFKRTGNGNLLGEFSNCFLKGNSTESADLIRNVEDFEGEYNSSWQEGGSSLFAKLFIEKKVNCKGIYTLRWERNGTIIFWGEGLICNDVLIGDYRNFKDIK